MSANRPPVFSSPDLQATFDAVRPILEGAERARNKVSEDIKALEAELQGLGLKSTFRYAFEREYLVEGDSRNNGSMMEYYEGSPCIVQEESLLWAQDKSGKHRLLYEIKKWDGCVDFDAPGGPYFCDESTLKIDTKPLIESKFEIRKRMYAHLDVFLRGLARDVSIEPAIAFDAQHGMNTDIPF